MERISLNRKTILQQMYKRLIRNFLDILILQELRSKPLSGYDIISLIHKRFNLLISSGSIYSMLYSLEREGLVRGGWVGRKRVYILTNKGRTVLEAVIKSRVKVERIIFQIFSKNSKKYVMGAKVMEADKKKTSEMLKDISGYVKI